MAACDERLAISDDRDAATETTPDVAAPKTDVASETIDPPNPVMAEFTTLPTTLRADERS